MKEINKNMSQNRFNITFNKQYNPKLIILLILLILLTLNLYSKEVSWQKAIISSAILPGTGEFYTQNYTKTGIFLSSEMAIIFSYFRFQSERDWAINSYEKFAFSKASLSEGNTNIDYQMMQNFINSNIYNDNVIRAARNYYLIYLNDQEKYQEYLDKYLIPENESWNWQTKKNWKKYKSLRRDKQDYEIYTKFAFAAAIINRIVSVVDTFVLTPKFNRKNRNLGKLSLAPDFKKKGMSLKYEYKF